MKGLTGGVAGVLLLRLSAALLGFVNGIVLARMLGASQLGEYAIAVSLINLLAMLSLLGQPTLVTREVAAKAEMNHWGGILAVVSTAHRGSFSAILIIWVSGFIAYSLLGDEIRGKVAKETLITCAMIFPVLAISQLRAAILRGLHRVVLADIPDTILRPTIIGLVAVVWAVVVGPHWTSFEALVANLAATLGALIVGGWLLLTRRPPSLRHARRDPVVQGWWLSALPFFGASVITVLDSQVSLYLLGYFSGAAAAGEFQVALQLVGLLSLGLAAVNMPLQPRLAASFARGDLAGAQKLLSESARMSTGFALAGAILVLLFAESLVSIYGDDYLNAVNALRILAAGQFVNGMSGSCGVLLQMSGRQGVVLKGTLMSLSLSSVVSWVLIPDFGLEGAAISVALGVTCWNLYFVYFSLRYLKLDSTVFGLTRKNFDKRW